MADHEPDTPSSLTLSLTLILGAVLIAATLLI